MESNFKYNRKTSRMTCTEKYITNEENNIIRVCSTNIILLIFMGNILFLYRSNAVLKLILFTVPGIKPRTREI